MEMTFRWFGEKSDHITLEMIRQIPGVSGVITTLYNTMPGEEWDYDEIKHVVEITKNSGLKVSGIESVNIHDSIKVGDRDRDKYIENYIHTLEKLGKNDIHMVCYNFMPVFDWTRSDLAKKRKDNSTVLFYDQKEIDKINPENMFSSIGKESNGFVLPGWEPERMARVKDLFKMYEGVDEKVLFNNLIYFLKAIMPVCDKYDINMAIHPDDPAWSVFGLSRIVNSKDGLLKMLNAVNNKHNGVTLCTGSLGSNPKNDLIDIIHALKGRIHFAHLRNIEYLDDGVFQEAAHLSKDGSLDMYEILKALYVDGFDGPIRPDHGRMIWNEKGMPGYGLYDRALGCAYLNGIWEALEKEVKR